LLDDQIIEIPSVVPIFPLPEVVLFPRAVLPLHVFEPRYREMTADALAGDRIMATALLKPGFEPAYYTLRAPIHSVLGIGQILASEELDDGNYNILLRGVGRARICEEVPHEPYRMARIASLELPPKSMPCQLKFLRSTLQKTLRAESVADSEILGHWLRLFDTQLELGDLADLIASGLPIDAELRQDLLAEPDAAARTSILIDHIRTLAAITRARRTQQPGAAWRMN
jgi:Lon protease-like protein